MCWWCLVHGLMVEEILSVVRWGELVSGMTYQHWRWIFPSLNCEWNISPFKWKGTFCHWHQGLLPSATCLKMGESLFCWSYFTFIFSPRYAMLLREIKRHFVVCVQQEFLDDLTSHFWPLNLRQAKKWFACFKYAPREKVIFPGEVSFYDTLCLL